MEDAMKTAEEIEAKVVELICNKLGIPKEKIKMESNFISDLGADSLDLYDLVTDLEDEFGMKMPDEEISKIKTVGDVVEFIKTQQTTK
jgi:acyl carrier protein